MTPISVATMFSLMEIRTDIPVPKSLSDLLRDLPVGGSVRLEPPEFKPASVRSTITRLKDGGRDFTTRPEGAGLRVWRTA